jgi:hypothetical protein
MLFPELFSGPGLLPSSQESA